MPTNDLLALIAGAVAGCLGALVGIGGGVLLVPVLNRVMGLGFDAATSISLVGVLATSSSAGISGGRRLLNARLALLLLLFSVSGATIGAKLLVLLSLRSKELIFGITAATIAGVMLVRLNRRNILPLGTEPGTLGGQFHDDDSGEEVVYRVQRTPLAAGVSFAAGMLTSFIGIGGGILIVPLLNTLCGVPMRVAAATSVLMVGVTAVPSLTAQWARGSLGDFHLAGMTAIGVLMGFQVGLAISPRARVRWLKMTMAGLLVIVAAQYLFFR